MKLWNQNSKDKNSAIDHFLSSEDITLDQELFLYDIEASIAHAHELEKINIFTKTEARKVISSLSATDIPITTDPSTCESTISGLMIFPKSTTISTFSILSLFLFPIATCTTDATIPLPII